LECIICGINGNSKGICERCGDPEMVFIRYNRLTIKMTPEKFFYSKIKELLEKDGVNELSTPEKYAGLVIRVKAPRGRIETIEVFKVENPLKKEGVV